MMLAKTIETRKSRRTTHIRLNRPEVHHALNLALIRELTQAVDQAGSDPDTDILLISAPGPHFCAGADLQWMRSAASQNEEELASESRELAALFQTISSSSCLTITAVQGKVLGGAIGLVAASDLVLAEESSSFAFSEVKLGLIPATIAPFVIRKAGIGRSLAWMSSGETFSAAEAREAGLVHQLCGKGEIEGALDSLAGRMLENGPGAMGAIKSLLRELETERDPKGRIDLGVEALVQVRLSGEGQEGMTAFLEKRHARWRKDGENE